MSANWDSLEWLHINHIRSGIFQTANDQGGGRYKPTPPSYDLEKYCINHHHIMHVHFTMRFRHVPLGIFQNFAILTIYSDFKNKK